MGVEPTRRALRISPELKSGRPTGDDVLPYSIDDKPFTSLSFISPKFVSLQFPTQFPIQFPIQFTR